MTLEVVHSPESEELSLLKHYMAWVDSHGTVKAYSFMQKSLRGYRHGDP
jgi:hypothetical protein